MVGDFNLHTDNRNDNKATDFINLLDDLGLMQHVHGPTHNHGQWFPQLKMLHCQTISVLNLLSVLSPQIAAKFTR